MLWVCVLVNSSCRHSCRRCSNHPDFRAAEVQYWSDLRVYLQEDSHTRAEFSWWSSTHRYVCLLCALRLAIWFCVQTGFVCTSRCIIVHCVRADRMKERQADWQTDKERWLSSLFFVIVLRWWKQTFVVLPLVFNMFGFFFHFLTFQWSDRLMLTSLAARLMISKVVLQVAVFFKVFLKWVAFFGIFLVVQVCGEWSSLCFR